MEDNYLVGLFVLFLFSFVLFKKEKKTTIAIRTPKKLRSSSLQIQTSDVTGVAKYLQNQQDEVMQSKVTGVAKYLQEKEVLDFENTESLAVSGVAKYLASKEETPVSGVSKYMARQAIYEKKMAKENVSGVEKYLNNRS